MQTTFNKSEIMNTAWKETRVEIKRRALRRLEQIPTAKIFARHLQEAWRFARVVVFQARAEAARMAQLVAMGVEALKAAILAAENADYQGHEGRARLADLQTALAQAEAEKKREIIQAAQGQFVGVTFTKKDGSLRAMKVQPAALKYHVKGEYASEVVRRAVEARKVNHPHLMPVWDVEAQAVRSVNLATVSRIAASGVVHAF